MIRSSQRLFRVINKRFGASGKELGIGIRREENILYKSFQCRRFFKNHVVQNSSLQSQEKKNILESSSIRTIESNDNKKVLTVKWQDGNTSSFHASWLRMFCQCPKCQDYVVSTRIYPIEKIPLDVTLQSATISDTGTLNVRWNEEDHEGLFPSEYLKENDYTGDRVQKKRDKRKMKFFTDMVVPEISWKEVQSSDEAVLKWLKQINERGLSLLKDVPTDRNYVKKVVSKMGPLRNTLYGESWDVITMEKPTNLAYTDESLAFHSDLVFYEIAPGIQFLHCLKFDEQIKGSETTFLDLFHVVDEFKKTNPEEFRLLTKTNFSFNRIHYERDNPVHMVINRPLIILNDEDEVIRITWHSGMLGPAALPQDQMEDALRAYKILGRAIANFPYKMQVRLKPTDLICFNNRRLLHGRNARKESGSFGMRHLEGCYLDIDDLKSTLTILSRKYGDTSPIKRMGDMDY